MSGGSYYLIVLLALIIFKKFCVYISSDSRNGEKIKWIGY